MIIREEPDAFNSYRPPNYYGSGGMSGMPGHGSSARMDEEFSECESLVNGHNGYHPGHVTGHHTLPAHAHHASYARPPPVALEFSDSLSRRGHRPAPHYSRRQQFQP